MSKTLVIGTIAGVLLVFALVGLFLWQMQPSSPVQQTPPPPAPSQPTVEQTPPPASSPEPQAVQETPLSPKEGEEKRIANIQIKNGVVVGGEDFCRYGVYPYKEDATINIDQDGQSEIFISCFDYWGGWAYVLDQNDEGWNIVWREYAEGKSVRPPEVVDIEGDGIHEVYWLEADSGGTCTCYGSTMTVYSLGDSKEFSLSRGGCFDNQCDYVVESSFRFSENLQEVQYPSREYRVKKFLLEKNREGLTSNENLSSGVGVVFPNSRDALTLGSTYYVSIITVLNEEEYVSRTGEIGVALYKGDERLGLLNVHRFSEFFFEWKAGEYLTLEQEIKTASSGEGYRIQMYSVTGLEDFSDAPFALVKGQE